MRWLSRWFGTKLPKPGTRLLCVGHGIGEVITEREGDHGRQLVVRMDEGGWLHLAADAVAERTRPPLSPSEARGYVERLTTGEPVDVKAVRRDVFDVQLDLAIGTFDGTVEATRKCLAAGPWVDGDGLELRRDAGRAVLSPLADALGTRADALASEVAGAHGASDRPPPPVTVDQFESAVDLSVGDVTLAVRPGTWHIESNPSDLIVLWHEGVDVAALFDGSVPYATATCVERNLTFGEHTFRTGEAVEVLVAEQGSDVVVVVVQW